MTRRSRRLITTAACAGLLSLSGCALGGEESPAPQPKPTGLRDFDPCTFLTADDLKTAGVAEPGEQVENFSFEPGCRFEGEKTLLTLYKNQDETVISYATGGNWDRYEQLDINGRNAARAISGGSSESGICNVLIDAGGGIAMITVSGALPDDVPDPCGEAEKLARRIEPRLPS